MPKRKRTRDKPGVQSRRFLKTAELAGVDESGRKFERAFRRVVKPKRKAGSHV